MMSDFVKFLLISIGATTFGPLLKIAWDKAWGKTKGQFEQKGQ